MRLFIGIPVPLGLAEELVECARGLRLQAGRVSPAKNLHLTLVFLGEVADAGPVASALDGLEHAAFGLEVVGFGHFGRRVFFAEVQLTPELAALQADMARRMERLGFAGEERPYHPHLTLARSKVAMAIGPRIVERWAEPRRFAADEVVLYRSRPGAGGSVYEAMHTRQLTGRAGK